MTTGNQVTALALPDETQFKLSIQAINRFQNIVHQNLILNQDYGVIPGTQRPTLLKPGAEKIAKLLGLADQYEIMDRQEDWVKPFFRYLIKCKLVHIATQVVITEGLGECNSMESKYRYRWVGERDLPPNTDKTKLVSQQRGGKAGGHWMVYRFDNEDIYSQLNTILKMAKKRALVDAALSAGRLSNVFTQDIEDMGNISEDEPKTTPPPAEKPETTHGSGLTSVEGEQATGEHVPKATPEQATILRKFATEKKKVGGKTLAETMREYGWAVPKNAEDIPFAQAERLIKEFTETKEEA